MFSLIDPRVWLLFALSLALSFGTGYSYKAYRVALATAAVTAQQDTAQQTVTTTVKVTDTAAIARLNQRIAAAQARATYLESLINEAAHARPPAAVDADCRLPDGLRDAINADLATGTR